MKWSREVMRDRHMLRTMETLLIFGLLAFLFGQKWLLFTFIAILLLLVAHRLYLQNIGNSITLENMKEKTHLFIDEETAIELTILNKGLPVINATMTIIFDHCLEPLHHPFSQDKAMIKTKVPCTIWSQEMFQLSLPVIAKKRGSCRIRKITLSIPQLFGSGSVLLTYEPSVKKEFLVFPEKTPIHIPRQQKELFLGTMPVYASLFSDPLQPIGTREYRDEDPMQHIHWKASARTMSLQTKIFTKTTAHSWLLTFNIAYNQYSLSSKFEIYIRYVAYLINIAEKNHIPYALAINVRTFRADTGYYYLPEGEGGRHHQQALELLSYLSWNMLTFPYEQMLASLETVHAAPIVIHIGEKTENTDRIFERFEQRGSNLFFVETVGEKGVLKPWRTKQTSLEQNV